jgi:hypothetical protein
MDAPDCIGFISKTGDGKMKIIINDIDGNAHHTVDSGTESEVRSRLPLTHPVQSLITEAIEDGGLAEDTYEIDGEEYTTLVIATPG